MCEVYPQGPEHCDQLAQQDCPVPVPIEHGESFLHLVDLQVRELVRQAGHVVSHWVVRCQVPLTEAFKVAKKNFTLFYGVWVEFEVIFTFFILCF